MDESASDDAEIVQSWTPQDSINPYAVAGDLAAWALGVTTGVPLETIDLDAYFDNAVREFFGIPPGFPLWYQPGQLALTAGKEATR